MKCDDSNYPKVSNEALEKKETFQNNPKYVFNLLKCAIEIVQMIHHFERLLSHANEFNVELNKGNRKCNDIKVFSNIIHHHHRNRKSQFDYIL